LVAASIAAQVHGDIVHGAVQRSYEFRLCTWGDLKMQSANRSRLSGQILIVLHEIAADAHVSELGLAESNRGLPEICGRE
jgi:hypothetical protein